jgi:CRISPR-associated protein Cst2
MSHLNGILLIDAPASALNNAGEDSEARTDNAVAVKFIRTPDGRYPYVSSQAIRFWLRTQLAQTKGWTASPVFRETKVAYTDAEPTKYAEDDLFGYMRAASKSTDEAKAKKREEIAAKSTAVDVDTGEVTRVSPFRVGTAVATAPVRIVSDFGTMARAEGDPVPYEHQFYRAHLKAPFALDLTNAGTFFVSKRVGYKNLDKNRIENAKSANATEVKIRGFDAHRLPLATRRERVALLLTALGRMEGGAKQTLHLTDTSPSVLVLAVCKSGNQPFQRLFASDDLEHTVFRTDVLDEALRVFSDDIQSDLYVGWAKGFLDVERVKLEAAIKDGKHSSGRAVHIGHPREIADAFAETLADDKNASWFD